MQDKITSTQAALLVLNAMLGVELLSLPRSLAETAGQDGWLTLLLAATLALVFNSSIIATGRLFPGKTLFEYLPQAIGKWAGTALTWLLVVLLILVAATVLRSFGDVTKVYLLPRTPLEAIMITLLLPVVYLTVHGLNPLARLGQVFFPLYFIPLGIIIVMGLMAADPGELTPVLARGWRPVVQAIPAAWPSLAGFFLVALIPSQLFRPEQALRASSAGIALTVLIYLLTFISVIMQFGSQAATINLYPTIELARTIEVPGAFIERLDLLVLIIWVMAAFSTVAAFFYMASLGVCQNLKLKDHRVLVFMLTPWIYLLALLPPDFYLASQANTLIIWLDMGLMAGLALCYLPARWRQNRQGAQS